MITDQPRARLVGSVCLLVVLLGLVILRSWVFVRYPHSHLDSDQAVFGLMGKDIALGRAYPLFMYGQRYMFAIGSWLCAPLFALFGENVGTLKAPMLAMNLACVVMLWIGLRRERELGPWGTALAIVPFAATGVVVASRLVEHQGGNVEPIFFLLLAFLLRDYALPLGITFGVAFLNREFTPIGFVALLVIDLVEGRLRQRLKSYGVAILAAVIVVVTIRYLAEGRPGYEGVSANAHLQNLFDGEGIAGYFTQQLPALLGLTRAELKGFNITSRLHVGHAFLAAVAGVWFVLGVVGACRQRRTDFAGMATYLILIGLGQTAAFVLLCDGPRNNMLVRYVLLSLCVWPGLVVYAWRTPRLRPWIAVAVLTFGVCNVRDQVRITAEYAKSPPQHENEQLMQALLERGVHYAQAEFWVAYDIVWMTNERIIISPPVGHADRVGRYHQDLAQHADEVVTIRDAPCRHGERVLRWYLCPKSRRR